MNLSLTLVKIKIILKVLLDNNKYIAILRLTIMTVYIYEYNINFNLMMTAIETGSYTFIYLQYV